jgi:hypothetical protein
VKILSIIAIFFASLLLCLVPDAADGPPASKTENLQLTDTISQYGITWKFSQKVRVGQFVNGDYYVLGPATIVEITPKPENGRNGSCLNVSAIEKIGFDERIPHGRYDSTLFLKPPITLKPGDTLLSSSSLQEIRTMPPMLWRIGKDLRTPVKTVAALTCLSAPVPPDAFRPSYAKGEKNIYLARNLRRDLLPRLPPVEKTPSLSEWARIFQRPWVDVVMDEFGAPLENMPAYGREFARAVGVGSLLLCLDLNQEEKEKLLINFVQVGIDLWGLAGQGFQPATWNALGGHANGRKWPIIFAGIMLGDTEMQQPTKKYPYLRFSEDTQTMFDKCWTGANVVYAGHVGKDGHSRHNGWGAYEHLTPDQWKNNVGESYRRCCTSNAWVGEALAARILHAEKLWDHDAFFAYIDRWMTEDDTKILEAIKKDRGTDYNKDWSRQGSVWDPFVKEMWQQYRNNLPPARDGHKDLHADRKI